ncbi:hypothetical protein AOXY_G17533 [Acipenser oxyrinchus oxyrinchus]|uniref:Uncharacterized protein n=1 Tax=Acipenser oxyrinchus oxyrinchus TaxID=40147 RepID=A0AAD8D533_ACIOX|nr:hypothetical protein AOXY_G17533 [Acipenser oxyrinchus oxyrinchus]
MQNPLSDSEDVLQNEQLFGTNWETSDFTDDIHPGIEVPEIECPVTEEALDNIKHVISTGQQCGVVVRALVS